MCGIVGEIDFTGKSVLKSTIKKMTDIIKHRGPDGEGQWIENNIGLGHRRLAIIDKSSLGNQPMFSENKRWILSYNGELYNYKEIRKILKKKGINFASNTDTEVVLQALIVWGEKALEYFNGMFALSFWDRKNQTLILARDRFGVKPLYYFISKNTLLFSSEIKAIKINPKFVKELNYEALLEYFTFQNYFSNQTLYKNINLLEAGSLLKFDLINDKIIKKKYWDYHFSESRENENVSMEESAEELSFLFKQAVKRQLISDVEVGTYLSGGLDSGAITSIASRKIQNLKTFTCGFNVTGMSGNDLNFDERSMAYLTSKKLNTNHFEIVLDANSIEKSLPFIVNSLEEPRLGQCYPNFYSSKLASEHLSVILSGTGGDELFGGYPWRYVNTNNSIKFPEYVDHCYRYWQRLASNTELKKLFLPISNKVSHVWTRDILFNLLKDKYEKKILTPKDSINASLYLECKTFLNSLFIVEDKLSMHHSLENRVPFMDNDLVNFAMECSVNKKLKNNSNFIKKDENDYSKKIEDYFQITKNGKLILRNMLNNILPKEIVNRNKQGFTGPDATWFKNQSIEFVKNKLLKKNANINSIFDPKTLKYLVNLHLNGEENRRLLIWSFLYLEEFLDQF